MERLVLVHGSVMGGAATWRAQKPLAERFELVVVDRPGFPPNPPVERVDFEPDAALVASLLRAGDHLVGHSYGGVIALLAAAQRPGALRSLTVIEPPATRVALDRPAVRAFAEGAEELWASGPTHDPEAFLQAFLTAVGSDFDPPSPLPPSLEQGARALAGERLPTEAENSAHRPRRGPVPEARRLRRASRGVRRDLRRARARALGRAARAPRARPQRPAPPGLQRGSGGLRQASGRRARVAAATA